MEVEGFYLSSAEHWFLFPLKTDMTDALLSRADHGQH